MIKFLRKVHAYFTGKQVVHFIPCVNARLELSDGDKAALCGWPETIEDVIQHEPQSR